MSVRRRRARKKALVQSARWLNYDRSNRRAMATPLPHFPKQRPRRGNWRARRLRHCATHRWHGDDEQQLGVYFQWMGAQSLHFVIVVQSSGHGACCVELMNAVTGTRRLHWAETPKDYYIVYFVAAHLMQLKIWQHQAVGLLFYTF